jgi:hypothetical protein
MDGETNGNGKVTQAVLATKIDFLTTEVKELKGLVRSNYITKADFDPVRRIVYGMVALVLTAVIGALIGLIIVPM